MPCEKVCVVCLIAGEWGDWYEMGWDGIDWFGGFRLGGQRVEAVFAGLVVGGGSVRVVRGERSVLEFGVGLCICLVFGLPLGERVGWHICFELINMVGPGKA